MPALIHAGQSSTRYLAGSRDRQLGCADLAFAVQIEASLPKLKKQGRMSGLKLVSQTGQVVYRGLRFTGDNLVKTAVIARFLANDAEPERSVYLCPQLPFCARLPGRWSLRPPTVIAAVGSDATSG